MKKFELKQLIRECIREELATKINPLDGKRKQIAKNMVYKMVLPLIKGFFSDDAWQPIHKVFKSMDDAGFPAELMDAKYDNAAPPKYKEWRFKISFTNQNGRPDFLYGTMTAHGAGTVEDPLNRYDVTMVVG